MDVLDTDGIRDFLVKWNSLYCLRYLGLSKKQCEGEVVGESYGLSFGIFQYKKYFYF